MCFVTRAPIPRGAGFQFRVSETRVGKKNAVVRGGGEVQKVDLLVISIIGQTVLMTHNKRNPRTLLDVSLPDTYGSASFVDIGR